MQGRGVLLKMALRNDIDLEEFLARNPKMRLTSMNSDQVIIEGDYDISAQMEGKRQIRTTYSLKLLISDDYPRTPPKVFEIEGRIPKTLEYHINHDGAFCLGSILKVKSILFERPDLTSFSERLLTPFLYSITYKILFNSFPYGDLKHYEAGLIEDYEQMFDVKGKPNVLKVLLALSHRKRHSNKLSCPCSCGKKLGNCDYRFSLKKWRKLERRRWFKNHLANDFSPIIKKPTEVMLP